MAHEDAKIFIDNVVYLRKQYGLSQKEMAKILGVGIKSLIKIENGELLSRLSVTALLNLSNYFNITPDKLLKQKSE